MLLVSVGFDLQSHEVSLSIFVCRKSSVGLVSLRRGDGHADPALLLIRQPDLTGSVVFEHPFLSIRYSDVSRFQLFKLFLDSEFFEPFRRFSLRLIVVFTMISQLSLAGISVALLIFTAILNNYFATRSISAGSQEDL